MKYVGNQNQVEDLEKLEKVTPNVPNAKKAGGISIGVLPVNSDSDDAETDRGNVPIQTVIKELAPQQETGSKRVQTPNHLPAQAEAAPASNYFSKTQMMFFPNEARSADNHAEDTGQNLTKSPKPKKAPTQRTVVTSTA